MAKTLYTSLIYGFLIQFLCYIFKIQKKIYIFLFTPIFLLVFNNNNNFIVLYLYVYYMNALSMNMNMFMFMFRLMLFAVRTYVSGP